MGSLELVHSFSTMLTSSNMQVIVQKLLNFSLPPYLVIVLHSRSSPSALIAMPQDPCIGLVLQICSLPNLCFLLWLDLLLSNLDTLPQTLHLELLARAPAVNVLDIISCGLKVTGGIVTPGHKDLVLGAVIRRLVQGNRGSQELLLDLTEALQTRLQLEVVVGRGLCNRRDDGDPVALGADIVCGGNASNVNI